MSISRQTDKEVVVHILNRILLSIKKNAFESVLMRWMNLEPIIQSSNTLATWCEELIHWKRPQWWERLKAGGAGDNKGWDGWMASPTWWTWVWASSMSWWRTEKPGMLQSMGLQRVGHDWVPEPNWYRVKFLRKRNTNIVYNAYIYNLERQ